MQLHKEGSNNDINENGDYTSNVDVDDVREESSVCNE